MEREFYAHIRKFEDSPQSVNEPARTRQLLRDHLLQVAVLAEKFATKANLAMTGKLLGLLHDLGKYAEKFQKYLLSATGLIDQDSDDFIDAAAYKGIIDHSTAGAQYVFSRCKQYGARGPLYGRMLALGLASHHSGLIDSLSVDGSDAFRRRMSKDAALTHLHECHAQLEPAVADAIGALFAANHAVIGELNAWSARLSEKCPGNIAAFRHGMLVRFLLSCLRDADCIDSACFEYPELEAVYYKKNLPDWSALAAKLERELASKQAISPDAELPLNALRRGIANDCLARAQDGRGLFTLTVPTGGGKTLSSLRFALRHAQEHKLEHVFYIIPYTSIIDQNAKVARDILESEEEVGSIILEHHSNILPEEESWRDKFLSQNWDAPLVFTTMVQFLESLFAPGLSKVRRLHNLANSVLIFDEIQTLPPRMAHLFCNALNFLVEDCGSSAVLCTATQPLLGRLPKPEHGQLALGREREIMPNPERLFKELRRVKYINHCGDQGMALEEIGALALEELKKSGSCLVVANTKKWARDLFAFCQGKGAEHIFYLSTALCPAHRLALLDKITGLLKSGAPVLCCSTQLIECGVDISFRAAIRFAAGLDSILQTAGRCNRNQEQEFGRVHIVRPPEGLENLKSLPDIKEGKSVFLRVLREFADSEGSGKDLSDPDLIERYFEYYFYARAPEMSYKVPADKAGRDDTLLNMLGKNEKNIGKHNAPEMLRQPFATAAACFQAIDSPTRGVIVPYDEGEKIIAELCSFSGRYAVHDLLRRAQRYTVNVYPNELKILQQTGAVHSIEGMDEVLCLGQGWYGEQFGLTTEGKGGFGAVFVDS